LWQIVLQKSFCSPDKNFPGCRRGFRVNMWGTSSPDDKRTGDLGNEIEPTSIGDCGLFRLLAGNLSPGNFGLATKSARTAQSQCDPQLAGKDPTISE
jgi:hypothetical protein